MGWSTYSGMTVEQAVRHELRGMDILAHSGSWWLVRLNNPESSYHGAVTLVQALSQRDGGDYAIKLVEASSGPSESPPRSIFRRWMKESEGQERGEYEQNFIDRTRREHAKVANTRTLRSGDTFTFDREVQFSDGVSEREFEYCGKFRALRMCDRKTIRLPRDFRRRIVEEMTP